MGLFVEHVCAARESRSWFSVQKQLIRSKIQQNAWKKRQEKLHWSVHISWRASQTTMVWEKSKQTIEKVAESKTRFQCCSQRASGNDSHILQQYVSESVLLLQDVSRESNTLQENAKNNTQNMQTICVCGNFRTFHGGLFVLFPKSRKSLEQVKPVFWSPLDELSASAIQGAVLGNLTITVSMWPYQLIDDFFRERKKRQALMSALLIMAKKAYICSWKNCNLRGNWNTHRTMSRLKTTWGSSQLATETFLSIHTEWSRATIDQLQSSGHWTFRYHIP